MTTTNWGGKKANYVVRNTHKYLGDIDKIVIRSSWEFNTFKFCDNNVRVIAWSSEEIIIPYMKPIFTAGGGVSTKLSKYYPDLYVEYVTVHGELIKEVIEVKPKKQTMLSRSTKYSTKLYENMVYAVNTAKWAAANEWCKQQGFKFSILTEDSIFR